MLPGPIMAASALALGISTPGGLRAKNCNVF
jgi:hypothetical protein